MTAVLGEGGYGLTESGWAERFIFVKLEKKLLPVGHVKYLAGHPNKRRLGHKKSTELGLGTMTFQDHAKPADVANVGHAVAVQEDTAGHTTALVCRNVISVCRELR